MKENKFSLMSLCILVLFFVSGIPALFYQIIWQHHLQTIFGAHAESVAIVVGAFMLGLGLGSLLGGRVAEQKRLSPFAIFALIEGLIGLYGYFSLQLFDSVGSGTTQVGPALSGVIIFLLVVIPTIAMGATLPILSAALIRRYPNVGVSVGLLYFVNTLGSGVAALVSVMLFSKGLGQHGVVLVAVLFNFFVACSALLLGIFSARMKEVEADQLFVDGARTPSHGHLVSFLAFFSGFLSLSAEIVWFRVTYLFFNGHAYAFPFSLGFFLFGVAFGSFLAVRMAKKLAGGVDDKSVKFAAQMILISGTTLPLMIFLAGFMSHVGIGILLLPMTVLLALPLGILFPLLMHLGVIPNEHAGSAMSKIYAANILGATLGALGTGFVLLEYFSLRTLVYMLWFAAIATAVGLFPRLINRKLIPLIFGVLVLGYYGYVYDARLFEYLYANQNQVATTTFAHVLENRSGVIAVTQDDIVIGSGVYDGRYNTNLADDKNFIIRPYALSAFHPDPKRVLMIGLSSGSWAQVLVHNPYVENMTIIEINAGYEKLIPLYSNVASLLENPKINLITEDGRRWLIRNSDERYDAIVMNTSFFWRAGSTNLLSREFLEILRQHLNPGGVIMYNTTDSAIVQKTGVTVFPYAWRFTNAIILSDSPMPIAVSRLEDILGSYAIDGKSVLDLATPLGSSTLMRVRTMLDIHQEFTSTSSLESREHILMRTKDTPILTDDNMLIEWLKQ